MFLLFFKKYKTTILENLIIFIAISLLFFFIVCKTGLLFAGFRYFIDDHQIVLMYDELSTKGYFKTIITWLVNDFNNYRFRPYYQLHIVSLTKIFGLNSVFWFSYITILGILTTFFIFLFGKLLKLSIFRSLIFSLATTILGLQCETWARPIIPDAHGMFFLSCSLFVLGLSSKMNSKKLDFVAILLILLMTLCKESYILFIPVLIFIKIWLSGNFNQIFFLKSIKNNIFFIVNLVSIFLIENIYILFYLGTKATGYAGVDQSSFQFSKILTTLQELLRQSYFDITLIILSIIIVLTIFKFTIFKNKQTSFKDLLKNLFPYIFIFCVSVFFQVLLYSKSGIIAGYYLFPSILVCTLLLAKSLELLNNYSKWLSILLTTSVVIILINKTSLVWNTYLAMANDSSEINKLFSHIELCTNDDNDSILIVANPRVNFEQGYALKQVLKYLFKKNNIFIATYGLENTHFFSTSYKNSENSWSFINPKIMINIYENRTIININKKEQIKAIVVFEQLNNDFIKTSKEWFFQQNFTTSEFKINITDQVRLYCKKK